MIKKISALGIFLVLVSGCSATNSTAVLQTATPTNQPAGRVNVFESTFTPAPTLPTPDGDEAECDNPLYPVSDEAAWNYTSSEGGDFTHTMSADDFGKFTITVETQSATFTIDGQCSPEGIVIMNTPSAATSYSGEYGSSTVSTVVVSGVSLPNDIGQGEQWAQTINVTTEMGKSLIQSDYTALGFENITVPAGDFYTLKVEQSGFVEVLGQKVNMHGFLWYAEGVGTVKSAMDGAPTVELFSYDIPE